MGGGLLMGEGALGRAIRGTMHGSAGERRTTGHELLRFSIATATDWSGTADDSRRDGPRMRCHLFPLSTPAAPHVLPDCRPLSKLADICGCVTEERRAAKVPKEQQGRCHWASINWHFLFGPL